LIISYLKRGKRGRRQSGVIWKSKYSGADVGKKKRAKLGSTEGKKEKGNSNSAFSYCGGAAENRIMGQKVSKEAEKKELKWPSKGAKDGNCIGFFSSISRADNGGALKLM